MKKELREKLEGVLEQNLDRLRNGDDDNDIRHDLTSDTMDMFNVLRDDDENAMKAEAEKNRCELEREKTAAMAEAEARKQQFSWLRFGAELASCLIPMLVGAKIYKNRQRDLLSFEEHGHLTTTAARQLPGIGLFGEKLPKGRK